MENGAPNVAAGAADTSSPPACPAKPVEYALPGGGGTDQFGAAGSLVDKPVSRLTFCIYDRVSSAQTYQGSRVLTGSAAQAWIDRINSASPRNGDLTQGCLAPGVVEVLGTDSAGTAITPLQVTRGCGYARVTNGTAVRFASNAELDSILFGTQPSPSSGMSGSPPR